MKTRAAVAFAANKPLEIVELDLEGPKAGEVLIEVKATGICHTDAYTLSGADPEGLFPAVLGHEGAGVVVDVRRRASPRCARATTSSRSTRPSAASASTASRARPTCARRSAPPRAAA